jgi:hypothetical protein
MKIIFTLFALAFMAVSKSSYAQCSVGGNGIVSNTNIQINGDVSDWSPILSDQDNITNDATPDTDAPISDIGRDFTRFAFTENISTLFLYFQRAGSVNNSVDLLFYLDVNNNGLMQTNEPAVAISWGGSNGNTQVNIYDYTQVAAAGDPIGGDGSDMPGSLSLRVKLGALGKGSANGVSLEVGIPFTELYKKGTTTDADSLAAIEQFKFHISSINGSVASVPGSNSVNDNFGGCYSGFISLPLKPVRPKAQPGVNGGNVLKLNNPVYGHLTLTYQAIKQTPAIIRVYNFSGAVIYLKKETLVKGLNTLVVPDNYLAAKGSYVVEVITQYNERTTQKILKL